MNKEEIEVTKFALTNNAINEKTLELSLRINTTAYDWLKDIAKIKPRFVPETVEPSEWFDKAQKKQIEAMNDIASNSMQCGTPKHSLCGTCRNRLNCRLSDDCAGCFEYERQSNSLDEIATETRSLNPIKEEKLMESAERIEITFKSGETITYDKDKWDDYAFDGKAVIVKKNGAWVGIYNFDNVFCVELKEK